MSKGLVCFLFETEFRCFLKTYIPDQTRAVIAVCSFFAGQSLIEEVVLLLFLVLQQIFILPHLYQQLVQAQKSDINLVSSVVCRAAKNFSLESGAHLN